MSEESEPTPKLPGYVVYCRTHNTEGTFFTYGPGGMFENEDEARSAADLDEASPRCISEKPHEHHSLETHHVPVPR